MLPCSPKHAIRVVVSSDATATCTDSSFSPYLAHWPVYKCPGNVSRPAITTQTNNQTEYTSYKVSKKVVPSRPIWLASPAMPLPLWHSAPCSSRPSVLRPTTTPPPLDPTTPAGSPRRPPGTVRPPAPDPTITVRPYIHICMHHVRSANLHSNNAVLHLDLQAVLAASRTSTSTLSPP